MPEIKFPDYRNSIINVSCSIFNHFGIKCNHQTLPYLDRYLAKGYKNIVFMLFDGMGTDAIKYHLPKDSFLRKHFIKDISSVFPPTTTAATVSVESGLAPAEHGWLGWSLYFKEIDKIVNIFPNTIKDQGDVVAANFHVASKYIPYKNIGNTINEVGYDKSYSVSPFGSLRISNHCELYETVKNICNKDGKKYIYTYWYQPDEIMHKTGCYSDNAKEIIVEINESVEKMCGELEDTLVIVTADHGHINVKYKFVCDYPNILKSLKRSTSIESRAVAFFVKEDCKKHFAEEFYKAFGDGFLLLSKDEVLSNGLFGDGIPHPRFHEFIGDYLAISISDTSIVYNHDSKQFISNHAGLTEKEMNIPLIVIEKLIK